MPSVFPASQQTMAPISLKRLSRAGNIQSSIQGENKMTINEEKELMQSIENDEWTSVSNFDEIKQNLMKAAAETAIKDYRINVRISKRDVEALKTKALEDGIPYQTLVTSILHKYVTGRLKESKTKETSNA